MLAIHHRIAPQANCDAELQLSFEARSKSRLRCFTTTGEEVGLFLERGQPALADGDCLRAEDGRVVRVRARAEPLLHVRRIEREAVPFDGDEPALNRPQRMDGKDAG